jgi:hypothetical protein
MTTETKTKEKEIIDSIKKEISYNEHKSRVIEVVIECIKELSHDKKPSKKLETLIKNKLGDKYTVYLDLKHCITLFEVLVWGNGIDYNDRVFICGNNSYFESKGWVDTMLEACLISNLRDYNENLEQEIHLVQELTTIEEEIQYLKLRASELKKERLTEHYIPKAAIDAKMRDEVHYWDNISYTTQAYFPNIFKTS